MTKLFYTNIDTPVGPFLVAGNEEALFYTSFSTGRWPRKPRPEWTEDSRPLKPYIDQFSAYFDGELTEFEMNLSPSGSPFQMQVWAALQEIPYGITWSYGQLAKHIGDRGASQAVGAANGANPLPIVIPCHRVVGGDGTLTGFGGGLETKLTLLSLENAAADAGDQMRLL